MGQVVKRERCPKCAEQGGDRSGDNMAVYDDGGKHCYVCKYHVHPDGRKGGYKSKEDNVVSLVEGGLDFYKNGLTYRRLHDVPEHICKKYGVKVSIDEISGTINEAYYPYYDIDGNLVACKVRKLATKEFRWIGNPKKASLFGIQTVPNKGQMIQIQEGEKDVLAAAYMYEQKGKNYSVVGIKDGANESNKPDSGILQALDKLSNFKAVVLAFDNDKVGQHTQKVNAEVISCSIPVRLFQYPEGIKDAGEMNEQHMHEEFFNLLARAKEFTPEAIYSGSDISLESLLQPLSKGVEIPFQGLQKKLQGLRKGELTTITASSGAGKSTLARELSCHLNKQGYTTANIFLEEGIEKTAQALIALDNNVPLPRLRTEPGIITPEAYKNSYDNLIANGRTFFYKHFGSMASETLLNKMRYFARACHVDYIFLDHLSMVISGSEEGNDERKLLDKICTDLAKFCTETGVGVIMVCHLRKKGVGEKSASEGGIITLDDLRGSGGIAQLSFNVISAIRDTTAEEAEVANVVQLWVLKNREFGYTGSAGKVCFNPQTGRLEELKSF